MNNNLAVIKRDVLSVTEHFNREEIEIIKKTICVGAPDPVLNLFIMQCKRTGLDPFSRQIYSVQRDKRFKNKEGNWDKEKVWTTQVSIDGFRLNAHRTNLYAGQKPVQWCGKDGIWKDVWTSSEYPFAAKVGVIRKDFSEPLFAIAKWSSYAIGTDNNVLAMWKKMPDHMLAKVAEALALRQAFPHELSGLYTSDEMFSVDENVDVKDNNVDVKDNNVDVKDQNVDVKDQNVDVKDQNVDVKDQNVDVKDQNVDVKKNNINLISYENVDVKKNNINLVSSNKSNNVENNDTSIIDENKNFKVNFDSKLILMINDLTKNIRMDDSSKRNFKNDIYIKSRYEFLKNKLQSLNDIDIRKIINDLMNDKYSFWSQPSGNKSVKI
jgi:phage recombination protein Bet